MYLVIPKNNGKNKQCPLFRNFLEQMQKYRSNIDLAIVELM